MNMNTEKTEGFLSGLGDSDLERSWEEARADTRAAKRRTFLRKAPGSKVPGGTTKHLPHFRS